jgi:hypothetical protein
MVSLLSCAMLRSASSLAGEVARIRRVEQDLDLRDLPALLVDLARHPADALLQVGDLLLGLRDLLLRLRDLGDRLGDLDVGGGLALLGLRQFRLCGGEFLTRLRELLTRVLELLERGIDFRVRAGQVIGGVRDLLVDVVGVRGEGRHARSEPERQRGGRVADPPPVTPGRSGHAQGYLHTFRYRRNVSPAAIIAITIPVKKITGRITMI